MDIEITQKRCNTGWVTGLADGKYWFQAKVLNQPSPSGINNGRILKLVICKDDRYLPDKQVYHYSRGLDFDVVDKKILNGIVGFCEREYGSAKEVTSRSLHIFQKKDRNAAFSYAILFPNGDVYGAYRKRRNIVSLHHNTDEAIQEFTWDGKEQFVAKARANPDWLGKEIDFQQPPNAYRN